ncbi:hypothetical protein V1523DRAFT_97232 [Lipomyces doorenjongii]
MILFSVCVILTVRLAPYSGFIFLSHFDGLSVVAGSYSLFVALVPLASVLLLASVLMFMILVGFMYCL